MLVVVQDRDVEVALETLFDLEATRRADVLEIDPSEPGRDPPNGVDDLVRILRPQADRVGVDVGEFLEQHRLAFHHRHGGFRPDVAQTEHRGTVGDHGHRVVLDGECVDLALVGRDRLAHARDAGRVGHGERIARGQWKLVLNTNLASEVHQEHPVRDVDDLDALQLPNACDHRVRMLVVACGDGDVANFEVSAGTDHIDGARIALSSAMVLSTRASIPGLLTMRTRIVKL